MKPTELQIGNLVFLSGQAVKVRSITKKKVGVLTDSESTRLHYARLFEVKPIPITEEWLMKNSFTKIGIADNFGVEVYRKGLPDAIIEIKKNCSNTIGRDWFCHIDNETCQGVACADVQYIHQVQNLLNLVGVKSDFKV